MSTYAVTSGKGGAGKSSVAVGLALAFCRTGRRVLLVDMDSGLRCLDLMLGIDESVVFDLSDALKGKELCDTAYPSALPGLFLVPAPEDDEVPDSSALSAFASAAAAEFDVVIFDFPAGVDFSLYSALPSECVFLAVCNPDPISVRDSGYVCERLSDIGANVRLILNKFDYEAVKSGIYHNIDDIINTAGVQLLGVVPYANEIMLLAVRHTLIENSGAAKAFSRIVKRLCGYQQPLPKLKKI